MNNVPEPITVSITVLNQMFLYLNSLNVAIDAFLRSLDVDPTAVKQPDTRIPIETYLLIQDEAARYTNDPSFGLHMGEFAEAGSWSILGYLMMNCQTLGEAFEKSGRYSRIVGNLIEGRVKIKFNKIKVILSTPPHAPKMSRHCYESTISSSVRMMRNLTGIQLSPLEVTFIYPEPESTAEYERVFRCPVLFGQKENSFTIPMGFVNTPILMANPDLMAYFEKYAQDFVAKIDRQKEYTQTVTKIILSRMDDEKFKCCVRTLQNRLKAEGSVFSQLHKDIRENLAKQYLRENYTVEDITYLLGFSEPSVFRKAFKKWAGVTPGQYRQQSYSDLVWGQPRLA